ncbi:MAG: hypothetical protein HOP19_28435 [Acidobacteria bacterium]|nr:hypothetical protein [Acidobacteriota bacterium]
MDQESQERFRKIDEMMLKFATNNLIIQQQIDNNNILLDQLIKSQLRLEASTEELKASTDELRAANEESRRRDFTLEEIATSHQRVLRLHEGRISQLENAA